MALFVQGLGHKIVNLGIRVRISYIALLVRYASGEAAPLSRD